MVNIDLYGARQLLMVLLEQKQLTRTEAQKILERVAVQTGADVIISF